SQPGDGRELAELVVAAGPGQGRGQLLEKLRRWPRAVLIEQRRQRVDRLLARRREIVAHSRGSPAQRTLATLSQSGVSSRRRPRTRGPGGQRRRRRAGRWPRAGSSRPGVTGLRGSGRTPRRGPAPASRPTRWAGKTLDAARASA